MKDEAVEIARLTDRQCEAIIKGVGSLSVLRALKRKGIVSRIEGTGMAWMAYPHWSALGLRVRAALQSEQST